MSGPLRGPRGPVQVDPARVGAASRSVEGASGSLGEGAPVTAGAPKLLRDPIVRTAAALARRLGLPLFPSLLERPLPPNPVHFPIPERKLPSPDVALADPAFAAIPPWQVDVLSPKQEAQVQRFAERLRDARRVLVVGHVHPPDGDCVGAASGLAKALRALGKDVVACVDDEMPAPLRRVGGDDVVRWAEAKGNYDVVVLVDVGEAHRIGGAHEALANAEHVIAIDHHDIEDAPLVVPGAKTVERWIDLNAEAASLQIARFIQPLERAFGRRIADADRPAVFMPLAAGIFTDTGGFLHEGTRRECLGVFKHLLVEEKAIALADLVDRITVEMPPAVLRHLDAQVERSAQDKLHASSVVLQCTRAAFEQARALAERSEPPLGKLEVLGELFGRLDDARTESGLAVLVLEEAGGIRVSIRSRHPDDAIELAKALGGGGKPGLAAAFVEEAPLAQVRERVDQLVAAWRLKEEARQRGAGRL